MAFHKIIKNLCCFLLLTLPVVSVAQSFQGFLEVTTTDKIKGNNDAKWSIADGNLKISGSAAAKDGMMQYSLIFPKGGNGAKFITQGKAGPMVFDVPQGQMQNKTHYSNVQLIKTDEVKSIAGVKCYLYKDGPGNVTAWVSDEAGLTMNDLPTALVNFSEMKMMLSSGINGFPMEITARDESGSVVYSQRVTSLQKTTVDPSEFNYSQFPKGEDVLKEQVANGVKK